MRTAVAPFRVRRVSGPLHADEVVADAARVRRLRAARFPRWARLPARVVDSAGTDNVLVRLPRDDDTWLALEQCRELWTPTWSPPSGHPAGARPERARVGGSVVLPCVHSSPRRAVEAVLVDWRSAG